MSNLRVYHCHRNGISRPGADGKDFGYQSYDGEDPVAGPGGNMTATDGRLYSDARFYGPGARLKYARAWKVRWQGNRASPDPAETRQLIWRNPPPDTVVTWCPYHRRDPSAATLRPGDRDLIVSLDGAIRSVSARTDSGHAAPLRPE